MILQQQRTVLMFHQLKYDVGTVQGVKSTNYKGLIAGTKHFKRLASSWIKEYVHVNPILLITYCRDSSPFLVYNFSK